MERLAYNLCKQWDDGYCMTADDGSRVENAIKDNAIAVLRISNVTHLTRDDEMSLLMHFLEESIQNGL